MYAKLLNYEVLKMARLLTPPVTVVQGDDAPDIVITLQQDSSGTPYVLTDKAAFVVLVDTSDPENYVAKFEATIEDESAGKVRISWLKDVVELTSYLDDLTPGKRYELQVFLGRTNLPPSYVDVAGFYGYFNGRYNFTGAYQEGAPIFKHATEELFLSRSSYDGNGQPDEYVWLVTSLRAATWDEVKNQDKGALGPADLGLIPLWNYLQILIGPDVAEYILHPNLEGFGTGTEIITPDGKFTPEYLPFTDNAGTTGVNGTYRLTIDGATKEYTNLNQPAVAVWDDFFTKWTLSTEDPNLDNRYTNNQVASSPFPLTGWYVNIPAGQSGQEPAPIFTTPLYQKFAPTDIADLPTDIENRGTQTVLTQIPLIVKPAYRLAEAAS
jgi:hypothetical protein